MKILNFGSLNIDYVYEVDHFVRPGETESSLKRSIYSGGKGLNQSIALARAGSKVYHAGGIGKNDGQFLKKELEDNNINTTYIREYDTGTGHAIIQIDKDANNCILLYGGANQEHTKEYIDSVLKNFSAGDYLILQNEINAIDYIVKEAHKKGMILFLNPSPYNENIKKIPLEMINYFLLNEIEAADICHIKSDNPEKLLASLTEKFPNSCVVLTLGKKGVIYSDGKTIKTHGIYRVKAIDTTAAGDTFSGFFISCHSQGFSIEDSLKYASIASSIAVSKKGAAPSIPTFEKVKNSTLEKVL